MSSATLGIAEDVSTNCDRVVAMGSALGESAAPAEILIAPWGEVESDAGAFVVDEESAEATLAAFEAHGTDIPVDYEHQTLGGAYSSPDGQAPAAGWIKSLAALTPEMAEAEGRAPGLWAVVEWTQNARTQIGGKAYRYVSPVAFVRRRDRRLVGIHSVGLTNKPAIVGMRPIVNSTAGQEAAGQEAVGIVPGEPHELRAMLRLNEEAGEEVVMVAAAARIRALEAEGRRREAEETVGRAMSAGKLTAGQREWALDLAIRSPEEFGRWERSAPALVALGRVTPVGGSGRSVDPCHASGITAEARAEYRANRGFLEKICSEETYVNDALRSAAR